MDKKLLSDDDYNYKIINNKIILEFDISIMYEYFEYFKGFINFKDNIDNIPKELLDFILMIKTNNKIKSIDDISHIFNNCDYYIPKKDYINNFIKDFSINDIIKIYYKTDSLYIKNILKNIISDKMYNLNLKKKLKLILDYNLKFIDLDIFNYIKLNRIYLKFLDDNMEKNTLCKDHIIFKLPPFVNKSCLINYTYKHIYDKLVNILKNDNNNEIKSNFIESFKILLNYPLFAFTHLEKDHKYKYLFQYIYELYKDPKIILKDFNNRLLLTSHLFLEDFLKIEILNKYINGQFMYLYNYVVIHLIQDNNIPEELIKKVILKDYKNYYDYDLLTNLIKYIKYYPDELDNSERHTNMKNFIFYEYNKRLTNGLNF